MSSLVLSTSHWVRRRALTLAVLALFGIVYLGIFSTLPKGGPRLAMVAPVTDVTAPPSSALARQQEWLEWYSSLSYTPMNSISLVSPSPLQRQQEWLEWYNSLSYTPASSAPSTPRPALKLHQDWLESYLELGYLVPVTQSEVSQPRPGSLDYQECWLSC